MSNQWSAVQATGPVRGTVAVPGSKSATNRALILAALATGPSTITGGLIARDSQLMIAGLSALGVRITAAGPDWLITPPPEFIGDTDIDCGLAGTVMRFLPPVATLAAGRVGFDGDPRARERPMAQLLTALRQLGADIEPGATGLPFDVVGHGGLPGGAIELDASASSQYVSALLLSGARFARGLSITHVGPPIPSLPHIEMTVEMLREHRVRVEQDSVGTSWQVAPGPIAAVDRTIEPDLSNALPFLAAAMVTAGRVTIPRWPQRSTQPGMRIPELLTAMGGSWEQTALGLSVNGPDRLHGIEADLRDVGELTPMLTALAALADSPSRLTGIAHLRGHETDRLAALATEINNLGGRVTELDDGLAVEPTPLHGGRFRTYADHRMATAGALLGLVVPGVEVEDIATTAKTLPDFERDWTDLVTSS